MLKSTLTGVTVTAPGRATPVESRQPPAAWFARIPIQSTAFEDALHAHGVVYAGEYLRVHTHRADTWRAAFRAATDAAASRLSIDGSTYELLAVRIAERQPAVAVVEHQSEFDEIALIGSTSLAAALDLSPDSQINCTPRGEIDPDAIVFDVDGTLVDSLHAYFELAQRTANAHGYDTDWPTMRRAIDDNRLDFWNLIVPHDERDRETVLAKLSAHAKSLWPQLLSERVALMADTRELIDALLSRGTKLGIVTASAGGSMQPMRDVNLTDHFGAIITRNDVQHRKPHPEGILTALERLGVDPARAVYVGDSIMDMRAAHAAGVQAVGVLTGAASAERLALESPHHILPSAGAMLHWLQAQTP